MCQGIKIEIEEKEKEKIMDAVEIVINGGVAIAKLETNYDNLKEKLNEEVEERKSDTGEVKDNYIARFDDIKITLGVLFTKIDKINGLVIKLFVSLFGFVFASTVFLVLNNIYNWIL